MITSVWFGRMVLSKANGTLCKECVRMKKLALVLGCLVVLTSFGCSDEDNAVDLTKANCEKSRDCGVIDSNSAYEACIEAGTKAAESLSACEVENAALLKCRLNLTCDEYKSLTNLKCAEEMKQVTLCTAKNAINPNPKT